jgi:hypothetical protein
MFAFQMKAFALLGCVLLLVDALAFHGEYREIVGHKIALVWHKVTPSNWNGMGGGRNWGSPHH